MAKEETMNINFNNIRTNTTNAAQAVQTTAEAEKTSEATLNSYDLTVSLAEAAIEDIKAAGLPEDALRRDDDLGKLVSAAFSLPPPPFPDV